MEFTLRCNSLKCRKELNNHAVVTTCSHVFCIDCSNRCQLSGQREGQRPICPACDMHLANPDDVIVTNLNPTEDYKTSVLSGLSPNVIMECAGRALSFWAYQASQEIVYQEYLAKNLTDKYAALNTQMDKIIHAANAEVTNLRNKLSNMQVDQDSLRCKNEEIMQAYREKSRKYLQTQELYDKLKRQAMLGKVQDAASDAANHTIQASVTANRFVDKVGNQNQRPQPPPPPLFSDQQSNGMQNSDQGGGGGTNIAPQFDGNGNADGTWAGFSSQGSSHPNIPMQTPSTHRQRLAGGNDPTPRPGSVNLHSTGITRTPMLPPQRISPRQPLGNLTGNNSGPTGFAGYGMSAGLKVSNPTGAGTPGLARPVMRSRVAQRPSSGPPNVDSTFGPQPPSNMFSNRNNYY